MWQDFFYFSKREKQGVIFLAILLAGVFLGKFIFSPKIPELLVESEFSNDSLLVTKDEVLYPESFEIVENKAIQKKDKPANFYREKNRKYYTRGEDTLIRPARNNYPKTEKLAAGTVIELNTADTTDLKKIPGIGSAYARRIVNYRNALGGFYRVEQLQEVYGMYQELYEKMIPFFEVNTESIIRIDINTSSLDRLKAHPYINFYQAKIIIDLRKRKKIIKNIEELSLLEEFTQEDCLRLASYLLF